MNKTTCIINNRPTLPRVRTRRSRWGIVELRGLFKQLDYRGMVCLADILSQAGLMTRALSSDVMNEMAKAAGLTNEKVGLDSYKVYLRLLKIRNKRLNAYDKPPNGRQLNSIIREYVRIWGRPKASTAVGGADSVV